MIPPYPLQWPPDQPRSKYREKSSFRTGLPGAIKNVKDSVRLFGQDSNKRLDGLSVTSNIEMFNEKPVDPGVAVWFVWDGAQRCIAVDRYLTVAENLQAIHHVLEARRTELRHAGIEVTRAAFRGFVALPPPPPPAPAIAKATWWQVLEVSADAKADAINAAYKAKARAAGGDDALKTLNVARDEGLASCLGGE